MIQISRSTFDQLRAVGLIQDQVYGRERNYAICNKQGPSRKKTYYLVEEQPQMLFLGYFEDALASRKIRRISFHQMRELTKRFPDLQTQHNGEHIPNATIYAWRGGEADRTTLYVRTLPYILKALQDIPWRKE